LFQKSSPGMPCRPHEPLQLPKQSDIYDILQLA